ncbi:MAG: putative histidine kinase, atypical hybrid [Ramlibacter sp.]|jgi:PAS domain S-box-containing protein|uniref:hybrid sensor histidine kinase/response regulator n=1 Tax=Ramlibacter sp. TaxID=1917967 RepID=UPI0026149D57|nr:response regulator [Ramlibacter sp.]MDB5752009.1 putative histidine kinase, atypical hybrid [Ramlibacter sp.]
MNEVDVITTTIDRSLHTVLVVDDNPTTRYSTARVIRAAGFRTAEAGSGGEALALAGEGVSAVVLDVHLPDLDGFEVCRVIRSRNDTALLPVVHLSAEFIRNEDRVTGLNAGADGYMVHPVESAVLVATLQALIRARMAEEKQRRSEQRFRAIYDQAQSGIALVNAQGRFVDANPAMLRLLRRGPQALVGVDIVALAPPQWQALVRETFSSGPTDAPWRGEFPLLAGDGTPIHLEWNVSAHVEPGLRVAIASDMSERHELEQRRRDVLEREQAARVEAERHSRTKDDFVAVLSHELRTPLNAILGWSHILKRRGILPEGLRGIEAIERNAKTQARIISDILDVSRINSGKLRLDREWIDPAELITGAIDSLAGSIQDRQVEIETDTAGAGLPAWLDPARFQQIFWNLMTNALKFSPEGGRVLVTLRRHGDRLLLEVRDFGQGIKQEFIPHLFERFTQSDSPGNRTHGGLGLGLSIVKHLVDLHGGTVAARSGGPGTGTTMSVELPAEPGANAVPDEVGERPDEPEDIDVQALQGVDVLLVEDDLEACEMLTLVLSDRGARVRLAHDFGQALAAFAVAWPDVLVSDIGLPGRDGYELVRRVRQMEQQGGRARLPVIALTAFTRADDRTKTLEAGFDLHLSKPLKPHLLLEAIAATRLPPSSANPR